MFDTYEDIKKTIDIIKAYTGFQIYWYVGYSGATSMMFHAMLEKDPFFVDRLQYASLLAPCTIPEKAPPGAKKIFDSSIDIYQMGGKGWDELKIKACTILEKDECDQLDQYDGLQAVSVKYNAHLAQIREFSRFQEFTIPNGLGAEVKFEGIQFYMSMYWNQFDTVCSSARADQTMKKFQLTDWVRQYKQYSQGPGHRMFVE